MMRKGLSWKPPSSKWAMTVRRISMTMITKRIPLIAAVTRVVKVSSPRNFTTVSTSTTAPITRSRIATAT